MLQHINPDIHLIFTVSPVRHQKEGLVENSRSKAHLISAIHNLRDHKSSCVSYFPSYEILLDELRDYRFYKSDMLHPSSTAIAYIWEQFIDMWMDADTKGTMGKVDKLQRNLKHKAFNPNSEAHQQFLQKVEKQKRNLKSDFRILNSLINNQHEKLELTGMPVFLFEFIVKATPAAAIDAFNTVVFEDARCIS